MMRCLHCGKRLPLLRKLQDGEFCSDRHRSAYSQSNEQLALARLFEQPGPGAPSKAAPPTAALAKSLPANAPAIQHRRNKGTQDEAPFASLIAPKVGFGAPEIGLFRMHPEDEDYRVEPLDRDARLAHPQFPPIAHETRVPRAESLAAYGDSFSAAARSMEQSRRLIDPGFEAEMRTPEFECAASGGPGHLAKLIALASRVPLPWPWTPCGRSGFVFLRPDVTPYRRQSFYRLPRLSCPLIAAEIVTENSGRDLAAMIATAQLGTGDAPVLARLTSRGAYGLTGRAMAGRPVGQEGEFLRMVYPSKITRGISPRGPKMPLGAGIDLRPFERVHGDRRLIMLVEGDYLGTPSRAFPTMDALLGHRKLAGAPRVPLTIPAACNPTGVIFSTDSNQIEEFFGTITFPEGKTIQPPQFRASLGGLRQLALASRNPLKHRSCWTETPVAESLGPPRFSTPQCAFTPVYTGTPGTAAVLALAGPDTHRFNRSGDARNPSRVFDAEWPGVPAPAGEPRVVVAAASERALALSESLYEISLDQICPRALPLAPKGEWEPELTPPVVILSSTRLALREEQEALAKVSATGSIFSGPLAGMGAMWERAAHLPRWATAAVMTLVMSAGLMTIVPSALGTPDSTDLSAWAKLQKTIMDRAAIALTDDFRTGLASWEGKGDWAKSWSYDSTGFVRTGDLALYTPTVDLQDYRVEFLAQIEKKALSWVVRAADLENYQVVKLVLLDSGPVPKAEVVRYSVIDGKRGKEVRKPLPMSVSRDTIYRVSLEIRKDDVILAMQGTVVDTWAEPRLARGGIGFFSSPGEKARLRWVGVWHQYDTLGRLCAYLAPYSMPDRERSMGQ
jgi:hypothetical protein